MWIPARGRGAVRSRRVAGRTQSAGKGGSHRQQDAVGSRRTSPEHADTGRQGFAVPELPPQPSLEHLRKQAKTRKRERGIGLSRAQYEIARGYGFTSWPSLVHHVQASTLVGIERA